MKKNLKFLASSAFISLTFLVPQESRGADTGLQESQPEPSMRCVFDTPEETVELPTAFHPIPESGEIISQEDQENRVRKSTALFREEKRRKHLEEDGDVFTSILRDKEIPVTYLTGLSIDGGGTRGLIPALFLKELSTKLNRPLHHYFDYIGGTSIGGILALALTTPRFGGSNEPLSNIDELVDLFYVRGNDIFPSTQPDERSIFNLPMRLWDNLGRLIGTAQTAFVSEYTPQGLEGLLQEKFGINTFLHQTLTNTLVTAVETGQDRSQTFLFDSRNAKKLHANEDISIPLWKVGRSTSAAPTYFPSYRFNLENDQRIYSSHTLVDGGLWLNNPSTVVARALLKFASEESLFASHKNIIMLSLGTGYPETSGQIPQNAGALNAVRPLIDTLMTVSSFSSHESLREILGNGNYRRINPKLNQEIELDETRHDRLDILKTAAETQYDKIDDFIDGSFRKALEQDMFSPKQ